MRSLFYVVLAALAALAAAQSANPFNNPHGGYSFTAGSTTPLSWQPTTAGDVTLKLQWGDNITPESGITIASNIPNTGSFSWTPPSNLPDRPDYTIEIISSGGQYNFLPRFQISGLSNAASSSAMTSSASPTQTTTQATSSAASTSTTAATTKAPTTATSMTTKTKATTSSSSMASSSKASSSAASTNTKGKGKGTTSKPNGPASSSSVPNTNAGVVNQASSGLLALAMAVIAAM